MIKQTEPMTTSSQRRRCEL